jgi:hypothetical protein
MDKIESLEKCCEFAKKYFKADRVEKSTVQEDKNGTDAWVITGDKSISVDFKVSDVRWWELLLLEYEHSFTNGNKKPGWTLLDNVHTDYIIYYYTRSNDFIVLPFQLLKKAYQENLEEIMVMCEGKQERCNKYTVDNGYFQTTNHLVSFKYITQKIIEQMVKGE